MFHKGRSKLFEIEKDTNFANRILALSMPSALVFIMLVALKLLPAGIAVMAYASIILFNIVCFSRSPLNCADPQIYLPPGKRGKLHRRKIRPDRKRHPGNRRRRQRNAPLLDRKGGKT